MADSVDIKFKHGYISSVSSKYYKDGGFSLGENDMNVLRQIQETKKILSLKISLINLFYAECLNNVGFIEDSLYSFKLVGRVTELTFLEELRKWIILLDDSSGWIYVEWLENNLNSNCNLSMSKWEKSQHSFLKVNNYISVYGDFNNFSSTNNTLTVCHISPIIVFEEIFYHDAQVFCSLLT